MRGFDALGGSAIALLVVSARISSLDLDVPVTFCESGLPETQRAREVCRPLPRPKQNEDVPCPRCLAAHYAHLLLNLNPPFLVFVEKKFSARLCRLLSPVPKNGFNLSLRLVFFVVDQSTLLVIAFGSRSLIFMSFRRVFVFRPMRRLRLALAFRFVPSPMLLLRLNASAFFLGRTALSALRAVPLLSVRLIPIRSGALPH
jgi:hypothetical protein